MNGTLAYATAPDYCNLLAAIAQERENVLDLEILVDDARDTLDRAVVAFRVAVRDRNRAAVHLKDLIDLHELGQWPC